MKQLLTFLLAGLLISGYAQESTGPTYKETVEWLKYAVESIGEMSEDVEKTRANYNHIRNEFKFDVSDGKLSFSFFEKSKISWTSGKIENHKNRYKMSVVLEEITKCTPCIGIWTVPGNLEEKRRGPPCIMITTTKLTRQSDGSTNAKIITNTNLLIGHPKETNVDAKTATYKIPLSSDIENAAERASKAFNHLLKSGPKKPDMLDKF